MESVFVLWYVCVYVLFCYFFFRSFQFAYSFTCKVNYWLIRCWTNVRCAFIFGFYCSQIWVDMKRILFAHRVLIFVNWTSPAVLTMNNLFTHFFPLFSLLFSLTHSFIHPTQYYSLYIYIYIYLLYAFMKSNATKLGLNGFIHLSSFSAFDSPRNKISFYLSHIFYSMSSPLFTLWWWWYSHATRQVSNIPSQTINTAECGCFVFLYFFRFWFCLIL